MKNLFKILILSSLLFGFYSCSTNETDNETNTSHRPIITDDIEWSDEETTADEPTVTQVPAATTTTYQITLSENSVDIIEDSNIEYSYWYVRFDYKYADGYKGFGESVYKFEHYHWSVYSFRNAVYAKNSKIKEHDVKDQMLTPSFVMRVSKASYDEIQNK